MSAARAKTDHSVNNDAPARPVLLRGSRVGCGMAGCAMSVPVPDFFTLPEVGRILRIGRNSAYKAATEYERTGGVSGLPFVKVGKLKRVSSVVVEKLKGGPVTWPLPDDDETRRTKKSKSRTAKPDEAPVTSLASRRSTDTVGAAKRSRKVSASTPVPAVSNDETGETPTGAAGGEEVQTAAPDSSPANAQSRPEQRRRSAKKPTTQKRDGLKVATTPEPAGQSSDQQLGLGF
jgi:hypothetical protein